MAHVVGIKTTTDTRGMFQTITIDAKKFPQAIKVLKEVGLIGKSPLQKEVGKNRKIS